MPFSAPGGEPPPSADILARLRLATRDAHASIETVPVLGRLLEPDLRAAEYVQALRLLHAFHAALEPDLARALCGNSRAGPLVDGWAIAAMAADIGWFGATPMDASPQLMVACSVADALGAMYVMEGSNLGGRVIGRHVSRALGVTAGAGGTFHCGLTADAGRGRWRILQEALRIEVGDCAVRSEAVMTAALATFGALEGWLRGSTRSSGCS